MQGKIAHIVQMTNEDPEFYCLIGPFLSRRTIVKAYGDTVWDDDGDRWFIAHRITDRKIMGFVVLRPHPRSTAIQVCNDYILPDYHQSDLQEQLIRALLAECPNGTIVQVTASQSEEELYNNLGFARQRQKGQFLVMSKKIEKEVNE